MASPCLIVKLIALFSLLDVCIASRILLTTTTPVGDTQGQQQLLRYHNGTLLRGNIAVNLIWYGKFMPSQRVIVSDFITSLSVSSSPNLQPSVDMWWSTIEKFYRLPGTENPNSPSLHLGNQILDEKYSLGKSLSEKQIVQLAAKGDVVDAVNVVLTSSDVAVDGFCVNRCGTHGSKRALVKGKIKQSRLSISGLPLFGPQSPPLVAPNNDVGLDGVIMSLSGLLAGTATNPFENGFYQGPKEAPLEAATACTGVYGSGAYPGYAGKLLVDQTTGASYNAHGANGRKYLLPAIYDPSTSVCSTLV
ncbi:Protein PHOSPHATE-INDUCED 1 [Orobanche gracilis]